MAKKVAIIHGWSEGHWHVRELIKELEKINLRVIKDAEKADIIIAHSLGTLLIPEKSAAKLIMLIGIPYWPGRAVTKSWRENLKHEASMKHGAKWWLRRSSWAALYILRKSINNYRTLRRRAKSDLKLPELEKNRQIIMIRNEMDPFMHPNIRELLPVTKKYKFIKQPGGHEDWWLNPKKYTEILLKHI